ncbi:elongation factor G [Acrasis kona]|uniref:Elongation factor G n=1 Tax=Acrasis kona TaxID=1008807 RepID=A0AAW2ZBD1_9EUKA
MMMQFTRLQPRSLSHIFSLRRHSKVQSNTIYTQKIKFGCPTTFRRISVRAKELSKSKNDNKISIESAIPAERIRNVGIIAHIDAGKTTTTERILFFSGYSGHLGDVDDGDTVTDYMPQEIERGITITSAAITFPWREHRVNLIDTPGHVDFTVEVERSVRVLDGAVAIFDAVTGVEAQTKTVWRQADRYQVPRIAYINKMDKPGASLELAVASMREKLPGEVNPICVQLPVGESEYFRAVIDLVEMKLIEWPETEKKSRDIVKTPLKDLKEASSFRSYIVEANKARQEMLDQLAEIDEEFQDVYLNNDACNITSEQTKKALRRVTLQGTGCAVLCGTSLRNKGVQPLMDAIVDYLPSPLERPLLEKQSEGLTKVTTAKKPPLRALAFKVLNDPRLGSLIFFRVYSGCLDPNSHVLNLSNNKKEKINKLYQMHANIPHEVKRIEAGNIGVAIGLKDTSTGDTLCDANMFGRKEAQFLQLPTIRVPKPVFFVSIEAENQLMQDPLDKALESLQREDPSLRAHLDPETSQLLVSGMGELHLEIIKDRLEKEFKIDFTMGAVQIAYRETLHEKSQPAIHHSKLDRKLGGKHYFAEITIKLEPTARGCGNEFVDDFSLKIEDKATREMMQALAKSVKMGIDSAMSRGGLLGFNVEDVRITWLNGSVHDSMRGMSNLDMNETSFRMLSQQMVTEYLVEVARTKGSDGIQILEPCMSLEVQTDTNNMGIVLSDLSGGRRAKIKSLGTSNGEQIINAEVPLSEMIGYSSHLRTLTSGNSHFFMEFERYDVMQKDVQEKLLFESRGY